jgi:hypothetical protein
MNGQARFNQRPSVHVIEFASTRPIDCFCRRHKKCLGGAESPGNGGSNRVHWPTLIGQRCLAKNDPNSIVPAGAPRPIPFPPVPPKPRTKISLLAPSQWCRAGAGARAGRTPIMPA